MAARSPPSKYSGHSRVVRSLSGIRQELTPRSLRHTFASWLAISRQPLRAIQELLGHAECE